MRPTELTAKHVIAKYVQPARQRGEETVLVRVGDVLKELGWHNRTPSVHSTLGSKEFLDAAGVRLVEKRGGPGSGGPSTTVQFVYRVLDGGKSLQAGGKKSPDALFQLEGIGREVFRELGGGETYLRNERDAMRFADFTGNQKRKHV